MNFSKNGKMIYADNEKLMYMGRIDFSDKKRPEFYWTASNVRMKFKGSSVSVVLKNYNLYGINTIGYVIDGKEGKVEIEKNDEDILIPLEKNLDNGEHEIELFKRQEATHYFEFIGFMINNEGEVLEHEPLPTRKIECFGDSVSAGEVCEAIEYTGKTDPENHRNIYDNSRYSYAVITARNLGAQIHDTAQGGIAVFDGTGYYHAPDFIGMETAYNKLCYFPEGKKGMTEWDFSKYVPDVVIFAVGQNDPHCEGKADADISEPFFRKKWKEGYKKIILSLKEKYPDAVFILILTVLQHDPEWDKAVDEIANELNDRKISHFMFRRTGKATPGHPRIPEQCEMAEELTAYISKMGDEIWH